MLDITKINYIPTGIHNKRQRGFEVISPKEYNRSFEPDAEIQVKLPKRSTKKAAGYDCFAPFDFTLQPGEDINIPTGIKAYMQDGEVLMVFPRSGLGFKYYTRLSNSTGIVDGDYYSNPNNDGHIHVKIRNEGTKPLTVKQGEAFCQFIFIPFLIVDGDNFDTGDDRIGGFGSTTREK